MRKLKSHEKPAVGYFCSACDDCLVDPHKPESGNFYRVQGHEGPNGDGPSTFVVFALCFDCLANRI
jgi:hypothetical protein